MAGILAASGHGCWRKRPAIRTKSRGPTPAPNWRSWTRDRARKCAELMAAGVTIYHPETCVIDAEVEIGADTIIEPFVQLLGRTRIGADCRMQSYSVISVRDRRRHVVQPGCVLEDSRIGPE